MKISTSTQAIVIALVGVALVSATPAMGEAAAARSPRGCRQPGAAMGR